MSELYWRTRVDVEYFITATSPTYLRGLVREKSNRDAHLQ